MGEKENHELVNELRKLSGSLIYISETDASFVVQDAGVISSTEFAAISKALDLKVSELSEVAFDDFFDRLTSEKEWHSDSERRRTNGFRRLRSFLEEKLVDLRVYRTGRVHIDIFIAGIAVNGHLLVISTQAVET